MSYIERPRRDSNAGDKPSTVTIPTFYNCEGLETLLVWALDSSERLASRARALWVRLCTFCKRRGWCGNNETSYCPTQESNMFGRNRSQAIVLTELSQDFLNRRRGSAAAVLQGSRFRMLLRAWIFVPCDCCVVPKRPADHWLRGVLAAVFVCVCVCVWPRDLNNGAV